MRRTNLALFALLPLLASAPAADEVTFHVAKGAVVEKTFAHTLDLELEEMKVSFGDEEISPDDLGGFEMSVETSGELVFVDEYREMGDGRPKLLARKFKNLQYEENQSTTTDGESEDKSSEEESELEGKTVLFAWDDDEDAWKRTYEGDEAAAELLDPLIEDVDLREFLPGKSVSTDDSWDVEAKLFDHVLSPGGDLGMRSEDDDEESEEFERQISENMGGEVKVTFKGLREEDGVRVAVLAVEAQIKSFGEQSKDEDEAQQTRRYELDAGFEGEILWDAAKGRPHSYSLSGTTKVRFVDSSAMDHGGEHFEMSQTILLSGPSKITGAWTSVE